MLFEFLNMFKEAGCLVRSEFRIYCPTCGGTRAVEALLKLHPIQSLCYNPMILLMILASGCIMMIKRIEKSRSGHKLYKVRIIVYASFLSIWFLFFIIRNILLLYCNIDVLGDFL